MFLYRGEVMCRNVWSLLHCTLFIIIVFVCVCYNQHCAANTCCYFHCSLNWSIVHCSLRKSTTYTYTGHVVLWIVISLMIYTHENNNFVKVWKKSCDWPTTCTSAWSSYASFIVLLYIFHLSGCSLHTNISGDNRVAVFASNMHFGLCDVDQWN